MSNYHMSAALKVMPFILLCWPMTSEAGVGDKNIISF